jgi:pimeloyl-ACP methyl ester carboxylesterase
VPLLRLPDGRDLEYHVQGPSAGPVVLFHHGMPGSAVPMGTVLGSMTDRGFRVITYSRAGYGASTPAAGRTILDTAAVCAFLLTHLDVTHYLVVGWSAGGPHALASAAVAPDGVEGVLLVASFAPFDADPALVPSGESVVHVVGQMASAVRGHAPPGPQEAARTPSLRRCRLRRGHGCRSSCGTAPSTGWSRSRTAGGWPSICPQPRHIWNPSRGTSLL